MFGDVVVVAVVVVVSTVHESIYWASGISVKLEEAGVECGLFGVEREMSREICCQISDQD